MTVPDEATKKASPLICRCLTGAVIYALSCGVFANPVLDHVGAGQVSIQHSPNATVINQSSPKAIINWQSFNINANEHTHFNQPAGGVALNRINPSQGVSQIYGRLTATGQIILVNPAGIFFGPGAYVNVGGLIATTGHITDQAFLNGNYQFTAASAGAIINQGTLIAANHGLIALIGGAISNEGYIEANVGKVVLAAGDAFTINFSGNELISFAVDSGVSKRATDKDGNALSNGVSNTGSMMAHGGQILISAKEAAGILDNVINMRGIAQARSISDGAQRNDGEIIIYGGKRGTVTIAAALDTSGTHGGDITITGRNIMISPEARINASGDFGGGRIQIGGNYQGLGVLPTAKSVIMARGAEINADAHINGQGGEVILWSDHYTSVNGTISARGGSAGGHGGFVETSSKQVLNIGDLQVDTTAANGSLGMWLLDPYNVTITDLSPEAGITYNGLTDTWEPNADDAVLNASSLIGSLNTTNVTVTTANGGTQAGNIEVLTDVIWNSANNLTLNADSNITMNANIYSNSGGGLIVNAVGDLNFGTDNQTRRIDLLAVNSANNRSILGDLTTINLLGSVSLGSLETTNITSSSIINLDSHTLTIGSNGNNTQIDTTIASSTNGALVKTGAGTLTLTGNNTYNGGTSINNGTLSVGHNSALGTNTLTINNGGTLRSAVTGIALANNINISGTVNIINNFNFTLGGNIEGGANLTSSGSGTTTYNGTIGANTNLASFSSLNNMILNGASITTSAGQYYDVGLTVGANTTFTSNGAGLLFDSGLAVSTPGNIFVTASAASTVTFNGSTVGTAVLPLDYLYITANTINFNSNVYSDFLLGIASAVNINTAIINAALSVGGATTLGYAGDVTLATTAGDISFSGTITGNGNNLIVNVSGNTSLFNNTLSNLNLVKGGTGRLRLAGNNTYGTTTINDGILQIGNDGTTGTLGTGDVIVNNPGTLSFSRSNFYSVGHLISGTGSLRQQGTSTLLLTALNSYEGTTTIDGGGFLSISSIGDAGTNTSIGNSSAAINIGNGTLLYTGTGHTSARPIVITANNATIDASGSGTLTFSGGMTGGAFGETFILRGSGNAAQNGAIATLGNLTKSAGGTWSLGGNNSYPGNTIINGGTLSLDNANALGTAGFTYVSFATLNLNFVGTLANTNQISLAGVGVGGLGSLSATQDSIVNNSIFLTGGTTIGANGGTLTLTNIAPITGFGTHLILTGTSSGSIASGLSLGAGSLMSTSTADWVIGASSSYSGGTTIVSGSLTAGHNNAFGIGQIVIGNGAGGSANASLFIQPGRTVANPVILADTTTGTLTLGYNNAGSLSSVLTGVSTFTGGVTGNNHLTLYNGIDSISGGTSLTISGSSINNVGTVTYVGASPLNSLISTNLGANVTTLTVNNTGAAALILSANNSYGNTVITDGTLQIGNGGTTGTLGTGSITINDNLAINRSDTLTISNALSGSGSLTKLGSNTLNLSGNNTYTGDTFINSGTLYLINANAFGDGVNNTSSVTVLANARLTLGNINLIATPTLTLNGTGIANSGALYHEGNTDITFGGNIILGSDSTIGTVNSGLALTGNINNSGFTLTLDAPVPLGVSGNISGSGGLTITDAPFNPVVSLSGNNTYTGATNVLSGILLLASNNALGDGTDNTSSVTVASGAELHIADITLTAAPTLTLNGTGFGEGALIATAGTGTSTYSGDIILGSNSTISVRAGGNLILSSVNNLTGSGFNLSLTGEGDGVLNANIATNSGGVIKAGGGTWILTGDSTYSGNTLINAGTLQIGNGGSTGLIGTGNITNNGNLIFNVNNTAYVIGDMSGTGSLTNTDTTLILTGNNTYSGITTNNSGIIQIGDQGTTGSLGTGTVLNNDQLIFARTDTYTVDNLIDGAGSISMEGDHGILVLNGANTFTGGSSIDNSGTIRISDNNALGSGGIFSNYGTLEAGANGLSINNFLTVFNDTTIHNNGHTFTLNGEITGSKATGILYLTGAGTTILNTNITTPFRVDGVVATTDLVLNGNILTNGNQSYANNVTLTGPSLFDTSGSGTNSITFNGNIVGGQDLTLQGSGDGTYLFTINGLNANTVNIIADPSSSNNLLTLNTGGTQDFVLTSSNTGVINNINNVTNFNFTNIHNLDGGSGGQNSLTGANTLNNWIITATNGGSVTNLTSFANMQDLIGGTDRDIFVFNAGTNITGNVDGGDGIDGNNDIDVSSMTNLRLTLSAPVIPNVFDAGEIRTVGSALIGSFTQVQRGIGDGSGYIQLPNIPNVKVTYYDSPTNRYGEIADPFYFNNWNIGNPPPQPIPTPTPSPASPTGNISPDIASIIDQPVINANNNDNGGGTSNYSVINRTHVNPLLVGSTVDTGTSCYWTKIR